MDKHRTSNASLVRVRVPPSPALQHPWVAGSNPAWGTFNNKQIEIK